MSLKTPAAVPPYDPSRADMRLPEAAFKFRADNRLLGTDDMRHLNITAWLYRDNQGVEGVQVNPNCTIAELRAQFPPADPRDAVDVGIHSEGRAGEFFRTRRNLTVLQIFTERIPCSTQCAPLLANYFAGIPVFYYYDRRIWPDKSAGDVLEGIYGIDSKAIAAAQIADQYSWLRSAASRMKGDHQAQLSRIRNTRNPMGRVVQWSNPVSIPELSIWDDVESSLNNANNMLSARKFPKAGVYVAKARLQYMYARAKYIKWRDGIDQAAANTQWEIGADAAILAISVATLGAGSAAAPEAAAAARAARTIRVLDQRVTMFTRLAESGEEIGEIVEQYDQLLRTM